MAQTETQRAQASLAMHEPETVFAHFEHGQRCGPAGLP